jgi:hypothetical protein
VCRERGRQLEARLLPVAVLANGRKLYDQAALDALKYHAFRRGGRPWDSKAKRAARLKEARTA